MVDKKDGCPTSEWYASGVQTHEPMLPWLRSKYPLGSNEAGIRGAASALAFVVVELLLALFLPIVVTCSGGFACRNAFFLRLRT